MVLANSAHKKNRLWQKEEEVGVLPRATTGGRRSLIMNIPIFTFFVNPDVYYLYNNSITFC